MITSAQLKKAAAITDKIERLQKELASILGGSSAGAKPGKAPKAKKKRVMSAEGRKRIAEAQKKRWAAKRKAEKAKGA